MAGQDQGDRTPMTKQSDGLDAVKVVHDALKDLDPALQERVIRWAREMLGLGVESARVSPTSQPAGAAPVGSSASRDIKTFVAEKKPSSDNQFAAVVAYYYRFEAP